MVDASEDEVVAVNVPAVSEPTVAFARVAELVAVKAPEVSDPIVAFDEVSD